MTLLDLLILNLGARFTKLLMESWLGKGAGTTLTGDVVDLLKGRFQSKADQKKAERELDELGDRMARELLPLFGSAEKQSDINAEAVVLALESTMAGLTRSAYLVQKDLDPGAILTELRKIRPLPANQFSQAETDLYERALESSLRYLVEVASRLPQFEEAFAARSLQQLSGLTGNVDEILERVRRLEYTIGVESADKKAREYEIHYRLAVRRNLDYLEIFGIDLPRESRSQQLSVAYVSLNLESRSGENSEAIPAEALFDRLGTDNRHVLIRGEAGSGKSTLLRWAGMEAANIAQWTARPSSGIESWKTRVPFLIRLRHCTKGCLPSLDKIPELIAPSLGNPPAGWVTSVLEKKRALLLIDGVDEVPSAYRESTRRAIEDIVRQHPDIYCVVSTRPQAVDHDWLKALGFLEARINPMSELDRSSFVDRWHEAISEELKTLGKFTANLSDVAESLKKELAFNFEVARLAANPLLCAMICALHLDRQHKLPERHRQLCEALCVALLHRRERESGLDLDDFPEPYRRLDYPQKRAAVQQIAHYMVLNGYSSLSTMEAQRQVAKALNQFPDHSADDAPVVTDALVERSGILREESPGEISFLHNSFKEFLAGDYFVGENSAGLLANQALDPDWQPVILFAVAADLRGFATKVIQEILRLRPDVSEVERRARQFMALRCRAVALYVDDELDHILQQLKASLFPPSTMEDAEVLAANGNAAVPFLVYRSHLSENEAAASVRALRLIGSSQARRALRDYLGDCRRTLISELAQSMNPLEIEWVQKQLLKGGPLPSGIAAQIVDLTPLASLSHVRSLSLSGLDVKDLSPLASLSDLESLQIMQLKVEDISPLAGLSKLKSLNLWGTQVADISPLAALKNLESLNLGETQVTDLSPLAGLTNLQSLYLTRLQVTDLYPLKGLVKLQILNLLGTYVSDLSPLTGLTDLRWLNLPFHSSRSI